MHEPYLWPRSSTWIKSNNTSVPMIKNQSFYQSILQNSILVIKVSGKICDNQENIENVINDIKELLNSICNFVMCINGF